VIEAIGPWVTRCQESKIVCCCCRHFLRIRGLPTAVNIPGAGELKVRFPQVESESTLFTVNDLETTPKLSLAATVIVTSAHVN